MTTPESTGRLANWIEEINAACVNSQGVCIVLFDQKGQLLFSNEAFDYFCKNRSKDCLLNPTFQKMKNLLAGDDFFSGYVTIGTVHENVSIRSNIHKKNEEYLIIGEINAKELLTHHQALSSLNQEISNLQRELLREKKALERTNDQLNKINMEKNRYLGIAAHDLRNPLGLITEFSKLIISDFNSFKPEETLHFLNIIQERANFSLKLLNELLDISKIESGTIKLNLVQDNYTKFILKAVEMNQILAERKKINLLTKVPEYEIRVNFDPEKIEQVINNLISNAIKYSNTNTTVLVKIDRENEFVKTEVIDQGLGISEKEKKHIFKPFRKGSTRPTMGESSTGLGLAIAKRILEEHNGNINVHSTPGKGSNFYYYLPLTN